MRISNDPGGTDGGPFADLLRLQAEFHTRLAEETMRYLRRIQGTFVAATPGTVLVPHGSAELAASGARGNAVELKLDIENRQRVHCMVTPMLSPLVAATGVTWFPATEAVPPSMLLAPDEVSSLLLRLSLPSDIPLGTYHGALLLQGFRQGTIPVTVTVTAGPGAAATTAPRASAETAAHIRRAQGTTRARGTPKGKPGRKTRPRRQSPAERT